MSRVGIPRYDIPSHPRFAVGGEKLHILKIVDFLRYIVKRDDLEVARYLDKIDQESFFLVAATGLGKTVAVPVHLLVRLMESIGCNPNPQPRVWVVEPRIPIAVDQMRFMNSLWQEYLRTKGERRRAPLFGCVSSSSGRVHSNAPIQFVTTGIFELMATSGEFTPARDRVVIDEAHVTVEQNSGVELGIALARQAGVVVDYMSATVDASTLAADLHTTVIRADRQRYAVWKTNVGRSLDESLVDIIQATLAQPDLSSQYFPRMGEFAQAQEVIDAVLEPGRSHGMLVVVNSFAGENSDIAKQADAIRRRFPQLDVLRLAGEVVRDAGREREFARQLREAEVAKRNYVILATSVVEMGITFPTLDYVVTMDCGYDQETIGDATFPVVAPLGVNSLLQRIGRVGRRRPGIAYIATEVGADYTELDDDALNAKALTSEPISFPLSRFPLMPLAYFACGQQWEDLDEWVSSLDLPSRLHQNAERMEELSVQIDTLHDLGLCDDKWRLTPLGERMKPWIGRTNLVYAVQLQRRFEAGCELPELMFWVVATALSNTPPGALKYPHEYFVDYASQHTDLPHTINMWSEQLHEDVAVYRLVTIMAVSAPNTIFAPGSQHAMDRGELQRWCNSAGVDSRKVFKAFAAIADIWQLFGRNNGRSLRMVELLDGEGFPDVAQLPWITAFQQLPFGDILQQLQDILGVTCITVFAEMVGDENPQPTGRWIWCNPDNRDQSGLLTQDDTPIRLSSTLRYTARLTPSRPKKGDGVSWRPGHLGIVGE